MTRRTILLLLPLLAVATGTSVRPAPVRAQSPDRVAERQRAVETRLLPAVLVAGEPEPSYTIRERMLHHGVPGLGIAVIDGGRVEWAEGYGSKRAESADSVVVSTLFQAASISKPVAAAAVLRLVDQSRLDLDSGINDWLRSWHVPASEHTSGQPVTMRRLLTHTAGLTVHGFPGYPAEDSVPATVGVLDGGGNTDPVVVDTVPGALWRYSGGGYTVAQVAVEDVTDQPFAAAMQQLVLDPLGMYRSTYAQPLPERLAEEAAVGHRADGSAVEGRWHTYPERAAAGLWTTPTDLARFALGIRAAYAGEPGAILTQATAREMLSVHMGDWGIGPSVQGVGDSFRFSHGGANRGYRAFFVLYPGTGDGVAVMTNSDAGGTLVMEVVRAVARAYGWPDYEPAVRTVVELAPASLREYVGEYQLSDDDVITITLEGERLVLHLPGRPAFPLLSESETEFFPEGDEFRVTFVRDHEGRATALILKAGGRDMEARRRGQ